MSQPAAPRNPAFTIAGARKAIASNSVPVLVSVITATNFLRIVSNLILTRLLAPEAFGVVGVLSSVTVILQMLTDMGYHAFIVRSREADDRRFLDVIWTIRLVRAVLLAVVMFIGAGALAGAFAKPELQTPIMAASFLFLLEGARSLNPIVAQRARRVSYVSVVEFAAFILQMTITIGAAFALRSFWAIIVGMYANALVLVIFSYTVYPGGLHRLRWDRRIGAELWLFARIVVVSSAITLLISQADKIFIGRTLSLEEFGLYMLAVNVTLAPLGLIRTYVLRVLFPLFAETARDAADALGKVYYASRRRMTLILAFLLGGGVGGGHLLVRLLFDDRYLGAGVYVSLLCFAPLFSLMTLPAEQLLIVLGRIRTALEANVVRFLWIIVAAPLGLHFYGVVGLVAAFALIEAPAAIYWLARLRKSGYLDWREEIAPLALALAGAAIGFGANRLAEFLIASGMLPAF
jgi:O-antigen/teichoic acid export membrane protein